MLIAALKPCGRVQRAVEITDEERHTLKMDQQKVRRALALVHAFVLGQLMLDLRRYDLPLVQLLMAEFALEPSNRGKAGAMRLRFLQLYALTCHTKHADIPEDVLNLPALAHVLHAHKPARELLHERLRAARVYDAMRSRPTRRSSPKSAGSCASDYSRRPVRAGCHSKMARLSTSSSRMARVWRRRSTSRRSTTSERDVIFAVATDTDTVAGGGCSPRPSTAFGSSEPPLLPTMLAAYVDFRFRF